MENRLVVVGAGGFAREVCWLAREARGNEVYRPIGFVVSDPSSAGETDSRDEILGGLDWLESNRSSWDRLAIGIGSGPVRRRLGRELSERFGDDVFPPLVHRSVCFDETSCRFEPGTLLCAGVMGTVNVVVERFAMVNLSCTLGHEARIGEGAVLNPTVNISGAVIIGAAALLGTGAEVLQGLRVGEEAQVGAGAVVTKDVPDGEVVVGIPAKPLRR